MGLCKHSWNGHEDHLDSKQRFGSHNGCGVWTHNLENTFFSTRVNTHRPLPYRGLRWCYVSKSNWLKLHGVPRCAWDGRHPGSAVITTFRPLRQPALTDAGILLQPELERLRGLPQQENTRPIVQWSMQ